MNNTKPSASLLNSKVGQYGGFSTTCDSPHDESYVNYDPEFEFFEEHVEMPYKKCNFRSEASEVDVGRNAIGLKENIHEFWPTKRPVLVTG
jgi:hypothetical protein